MGGIKSLAGCSGRGRGIIMNDSNELIMAPNWPGFSRTWKIVGIVVFLLLIILWLLDASPWNENGGVCGPNSSNGSAVLDSQAPNIALICDDPIRIPVGTRFQDKGAFAFDIVDGQSNVTVTGEVDYNLPGEYVLTYSATDKAGNVATTTRTVIVEAVPVEGNSEVVSNGSTNLESNRLPTPAKLYFESGSAEYPADTKLSLAAVIAYLRNNKDTLAVVSGFHSEEGSLEVNQKLAKQRAKSVSQLLQDAGVAEDRIVLRKPVETTGSGSSDEARRVEVSVR